MESQTSAKQGSDGLNQGPFGNAYVCNGDSELGLASFHFEGIHDSYISYENDGCHDIFPRLDTKGPPGIPGERLPRRLLFRQSSYDPVSRTFRGSVSFAVDDGRYEHVRTLDGVELEEYELTFSEDFSVIVAGECRSFFPNASKPHKCQSFGGDDGADYIRWFSEKEQSRQACMPDETSTSRMQSPGKLEGDAALEAARTSLLDRNAGGLLRALDQGVSVDTVLDARQVWQRLRWNPAAEWFSRADKVAPSLLTAALLLQWPEGTELCLRFGADANAEYHGPCPGVTESSCNMLRLALAARSQPQCLLCRYLLDRGIDRKVFQRLRKRMQNEMELDTQQLFARWLP